MISILGSLFAATIKGSLLILLVAAILQLTRSRLDPRLRHLLWLVVLIRLLMPSAPASSWSLFNLVAADEIAMPMRVAAAPAPIEPRARAFAEVTSFRASQWPLAMRWIFAIWITGVVLLALRTLIATLRMKTAGVSPAWPVQSLVDDARRQLRIRRNVRVVECGLVKTPALHGLFRPMILLPPGLASSFSAEELRHVVLHELWHLRRCDVAVSWILSAVETLHWFNPLVWFAASRIKEERELACDELALSCLEEEERSGYGMTILKLLERFRAPAPIPALVGIVDHKQKMKRRLTMIASFRNRARFSMFLALTVVAVTAIGLTDASGGERRMMMRLDPAVQATVERLDQQISFEISNATLTELLSAVANKTGLVIKQAPELATHPIQNARFTLKAESVPAHAVLMESLIPFELAPEPSADGVTIAAGIAKIMVDRADHPGEATREVVITNGTPEEARMVEKVLEAGELAGEVNERVFIRKRDGAGEFDAGGKLHREVTIDFVINGVKSKGTLTVDIAK